MMRLCAVDLTFPTTSVFFPMGASFVEESYVYFPGMPSPWILHPPLASVKESWPKGRV